MFQNIIDNVEQEESENIIKSKINIKQLFSIQDIVLYAIAFMVSMVNFNGEFAPFGLAIFAATCSNKRPVGILYAIISIGTIVGFGLGGLLTYILTSVILIGLILIFKPKLEEENRNEKCKLGIYLLIATFIVQAGKMIFSMFLIYDLLASLMSAILVYTFYKIFVNAIGVIKDYGEKRAFAIEEVIATSLLITIALASLQNLKIAGLSLTNIFSIMLVLFLGWKNGMLIGATSGITIGTVLGIITLSNPLLIGAYAISRNDCRYI